MRTINRNPLGIRKLDVQAERRAMYREAPAEVERVATRVWGITDPEMIRFATAMYESGWKRGVHEGAKATRDRVAEALDNGTLRKQEA